MVQFVREVGVRVDEEYTVAPNAKVRLSILEDALTTALLSIVQDRTVPAYTLDLLIVEELIIELLNKFISEESISELLIIEMLSLLEVWRSVLLRISEDSIEQNVSSSQNVEKLNTD